MTNVISHHIYFYFICNGTYNDTIIITDTSYECIYIYIYTCIYISMEWYSVNVYLNFKHFIRGHAFGNVLLPKCRSFCIGKMRTKELFDKFLFVSKKWTFVWKENTPALYHPEDHRLSNGHPGHFYYKRIRSKTIPLRCQYDGPYNHNMPLRQMVMQNIPGMDWYNNIIQWRNAACQVINMRGELSLLIDMKMNKNKGMMTNILTHHSPFRPLIFRHQVFWFTHKLVTT